MRQSRTLIPTLREVPADAEAKSHQLLLRAGFIRQNTSGVYSYMPLANKVIHKIQSIVREEMEKINAVEMLMPALQQAETWQESGRWYTYGPELMRLKDRHGREFALGATHEEVITSIVRDEVKSYKRLPLTLYQIQSKFRDEKRPRFGLLRGREFIMKDAYSFHSSAESLDETYNDMYQAYTNVFTRCGLNFRPVIADSGAMGGKDTHEFMALSDVGEDTIAYSDQSSYAANIEMAEVKETDAGEQAEMKELQEVHTPSVKTIEEVAAFLGISPSDCIKSMLMKADGRFVLVLTRGDHEVNDVKVKNLLQAEIIEFASAEEVAEITGTEPGFVGPVGLDREIEIFADFAVKAMANAAAGANKTDYHYQNVNISRDAHNVTFADLRFIQEGDPSPDGKGTIRFAKGIEVGQVFKLGTRYSEAMDATYLDENGRAQPMLMGCYGIGISRTLSAIVEQHHDDKGLIWPLEVTPYDLHILALNMKNDAQVQLAEKLYEEFKANGYDVLFDDRAERAGVKFADSDLIGLPIRITVGKRADEGVVEVKIRKTGESFEIAADELFDFIEKQVKSLSSHS
ncbi:proline--tRNA ligase [Bacillus licheniformis]|jgi:prolyl-tRNA synthetase|uniref:Proline--tRNA ligase n=3 Tax=Bacillus licheniformis TaxID=1402 RepID=SYP_BACLD|nr:MULTISPECIES: proline--tRNA ligase [Bacillus]Q65JJ1.1 RecName: Full=Proline--tRNA ligase; AltName: Full=Prolyl-tRNA synthetase; Short=ProRS [Bacillus licheniformis DSM 13 = ATCC 14580]MBJ7887389.1 proline--tRNA ligase [Bacillaceae bacterium HSR45]MBY8346520.1 proline--tRNA ligase [Bacillus sp. PCH94]MDP4079160.1 proline--tRNA ligase [Bacillota bacterium]AAU23413.1 prolyl-tRNA synthetase [Bacillus licheniformis DSM 13 = ATCC 14580]AAU40773.1 prolyl-tRNA ligase ProS [Bacillus licheniformis D